MRGPEIPCFCGTIKSHIHKHIQISSGPGSSVGIATDYGLDGQGSIPDGDENFRPSRPASGAHPASCTKGTGSFPGLEAAGASG